MTDRTPQPCHHKQANHQHGTRAKYVLDHCRCLPCAAANANAHNEWTRQKLYGRYNKYVDAQQAREHLQQLQAAGMGLRRVSAVCGISTSTLQAIVYGKHRGNGHQDPPSKRITRPVHQKIMAVAYTPAPGTAATPERTEQARQQLRALVALGWSILKLGDQLGIQRSNMTRVIETGSRLNWSTIQRIERLYEHLSMTLPPATNQRERISVSRAKNYAQQRGWIPPLELETLTLGQDAQDGPYIDEQAIWRRMHGDRTVKLTKPEKLEVIRRWQATGRSLNELQRETQWNVFRYLRDDLQEAS